MNRGAIRAAVIASLREANPPVRWTIAELNEYLDDGYRDLAERTAAVVRTFTLSLQPGQNYVTLPSVTDAAGTFDVIHPLAVKDVATDLPLDPVAWSFFDDQDRIWIRTSEQRPRFYAFWDWHTMLVYPHYGAAGTLSVIAAMMPRGFVDDNSEPEVPGEYHDALIHYGIWRCLLKGAKGPRFGRSNVQLRNFSERLIGLGDWTNERHEGIFKAIYGQRARVPADVWGN